jgi:hypothetical protein
VSSPTPGAFVYVSLDGSDPSLQSSGSLFWAQDGPGVEGPHVTLHLSTPGCTTLRAYASRGDLLPSDVTAATYCVNGGSLCDCELPHAYRCLHRPGSPCTRSCCPSRVLLQRLPVHPLCASVVIARHSSIPVTLAVPQAKWPLLRPVHCATSPLLLPSLHQFVRTTCAF